MNKITHEGNIVLTDKLSLPCYILEDGTRVISGRGMQNALQIIPHNDKSEEQKAGGELTRFINRTWFKSLITNDLELVRFTPIICYKGNQKINGYEATTLVDFCNLILDGRKAGKIKTERQEIIAAQCEILIKSFAKVGIIALVDEATGYQYDREKSELQAILKVLISDQILKWQEAFHLNFYREIFRLWGVPFTEKNIKHKPQFIGTLTNTLVYKNMPKGVFVLEKLKEKTPKTKGGHYKYRLHQSLTPEIGKEALKKVIYSIETLAAISENKEQFKRFVNDRYGQRSLQFPNWDEIQETGPEKKPSNDFDKLLTGLLQVPPENKNDDEPEMDNDSDDNEKNENSEENEKPE